MKHPNVSVTLRYGTSGEKVVTAVVPISESLRREMMESVELSDNPFSVLLASPGMFGGKGNAIAMRRKAFKMRKEIAEEIGAAVAQQLQKFFGENDVRDGYRVDP